MAVSLHSVPNVSSDIDATVSFSWVGRLRILLVIESAGGGSGRHVIDLAAGLAGLGHRVTVAYSPLRAEPEFVAALESTRGVEPHEIEMHRSSGWRDFGAAIDLRRFVPHALENSGDQKCNQRQKRRAHYCHDHALGDDFRTFL